VYSVHLLFRIEVVRRTPEGRVMRSAGVLYLVTHVSPWGQ